MLQIKVFPMNPFSMNTHILYDQTKEAIIIDPGNCNFDEDERIFKFIEKNELTLKGVYYTHCHIDHIPGAFSIYKKYGVRPSYHKGGEYFLKTAEEGSYNFGMKYNGSVEVERLLENGDTIKFGEQKFICLYTPGHADGSICFYNQAAKVVIVGDVLFNGSIGRTDLPTGDFNTLEKSIREKLYVLDDETVVYSGHGSTTTIGHEKSTNPFFKV